jgi:hypothetical protein
MKWEKFVEIVCLSREKIFFAKGCFLPLDLLRTRGKFNVFPNRSWILGFRNPEITANWRGDRLRLLGNWKPEPEN